jgi:hypothetical protein
MKRWMRWIPGATQPTRISTTRIVGPTGSRRRRLFLFVPILMVAAAALYVAVGALAVHDTGRFQLDGDASSATVGTPPATDDWDKVCHQYAKPLPTGGCGTTSDTNGSTSGTWASDGSLDATIFTGGGSKDPQDITNWAWKDGGGLPDKDNLQHAFAARYSLPDDPPDVPGGTGNLGNGTACPAGTFATCDVLYFGEDRLDNSGDAQNGFWFLQAKVNNDGANKSGGGTEFTGSHVNGDVLVVSDFSVGGTTATISVYKWDTACTATSKPDADCADANLRLLKTSAAAKCGSVGDGDPFCGITNATDGTIVPWSGDYTDKSLNHSYLQGEFYEAGINLSTLGLAGECFSSLVTESRSSTSTTATLKDFVVAQLPTCKPTLTTQASAAVATPVLPGTAVHDTATIRITGGTNPPDPTGTVTFSYCYSATVVPDCTTATTLSSAGTGQLGDANHDGVNDDTNHNDGVAVALSDNVNTATSPLPSGYYCFVASWLGDSNYPGALSVTNTTTECFRVLLLQPTMTTQQRFRPNDSATVTVASGTGDLAGNVRFQLFVNSSTCSNTAVYDSGPINITTGSGTGLSRTVSSNNTTEYVTSGTTFSWKVTYTSTNAGQKNVTAQCNAENSAITINNDGTFNTP